jgi:hypothetical protein
VNSSVGSFAGTSGLDGTTVWPWRLKKSRKRCRISLLFMALKTENYGTTDEHGLTRIRTFFHLCSSVFIGGFKK